MSLKDKTVVITGGGSSGGNGLRMAVSGALGSVFFVAVCLWAISLTCEPGVGVRRSIAAHPPSTSAAIRANVLMNGILFPPIQSSRDYTYYSRGSTRLENRSVGRTHGRKCSPENAGVALFYVRAGALHAQNDGSLRLVCGSIEAA